MSHLLGSHGPEGLFCGGYSTTIDWHSLIHVSETDKDDAFVLEAVAGRYSTRVHFNAQKLPDEHDDSWTSVFTLFERGEMAFPESSSVPFLLYWACSSTAEVGFPWDSCRSEQFCSTTASPVSTASLLSMFSETIICSACSSLHKDPVTSWRDSCFRRPEFSSINPRPAGGGGVFESPPSGFSRIAKIRFHPPYPPSFPQLLWIFRPNAMWGQVTRSGQVTQLQNNFPIAPRLQCFRESYETFGIWWGHQCIQHVYLGFFISVTSGQVIFATCPL